MAARASRDPAPHIAVVREALAMLDATLPSAADPYDRSRWDGFERAKVRAIEMLAAHGVAVRDRWDGCAVSAGGLRAGSTSGLHGALRNWLNRAVVAGASAAMKRVGRDA